MNFSLPELLALAATLGFASGVRLYAVVLITGLVGYAGWVALPGGLEVLANPWVIGVSTLLFGAEFFADKIPALDSVWDGLSTFVRIPGGALLAASVFGIDQAALAAIAAILGGSLAATSHLAKSSTRAAINTSPEPFSNVAMSLAEDLGIAGLLWLAFEHPWIALATVAALTVLAIWLIVKFARLLRRLLARVRGAPSPDPLAAGPSTMKDT
ncbi:MAG TPA: DUF4126 domain-containing protein [Burkholderiaceae bacterium]|nr:DUF4126 domain-containing protein [Burkholderiaceae bacterium]